MAHTTPALLGVSIRNYDHLLYVQKAFSKGFATVLLKENILTCKKVIAFYATYYPVSYKTLFKQYSNKSLFEFSKKIVKNLMQRKRIRLQAKRRAKQEHNEVVLNVFKKYLQEHKKPKKRKATSSPVLPA